MIPSARFPRVGVFSVTSILVGGAAVALMLTACGPTGRERYEHRLANTGAPAMHSVQSDRLREIMNKLEYDPMPDVEYSMSDRDRRAQEIAEVGQAMSEAAGKMPDAIKDIKLPEKDREVFLSLTEKLRREAAAVGEAGRKKQFEEARRSLERMQSTCNACHNLFRGRP